MFPEHLLTHGRGTMTVSPEVGYKTESHRRWWRTILLLTCLLVTNLYPPINLYPPVSFSAQSERKSSSILKTRFSIGSFNSNDTGENGPQCSGHETTTVPVVTEDSHGRAKSNHNLGPLRCMHLWDQEKGRCPQIQEPNPWHSPCTQNTVHREGTWQCWITKC